MKPGSIEDPDMYVDIKLRKTRQPNGVEVYDLSPSKYVNEAVHNVEQHLRLNFCVRKLAKHTGAYFLPNYKSELGMNPKLSTTRLQYYPTLSSILQ